MDIGFDTPFKTITGGIFEPGFPDVLMQMWAAFFAERDGVLNDRFGCATPEEARGALLSYVAYFGTYEVDEEEGSVTHVSEGNFRPNVVGSRQKRMVELVGDRLTLRASPLPGGTRSSALVWERV